jgi:hypothetical protein
MWTQANPLVSCSEDLALVSAVHDAFFLHHPLVLSPDVVWLTLARGFALHVNLHAEELRHRFVCHTGKERIQVFRPDFFPGADNPWPEVFEEFSRAIVTPDDCHLGTWSVPNECRADASGCEGA